MNNHVISALLSPQQVDYAMQCIHAAQSITIITHQNPDGDAMGSSLAMRHFLLSLGKVNVTNIVPTSFPDFLGWIPGVDQIIQAEQQYEQAQQALRNADLVICTDLAEPTRVASLSPVLTERFLSNYEGNTNSARLLIIDHHLSKVCTEHPEQIAFQNCASASELVFRLAYQSGQLPLTEDFATCIYTGMMTDTGNFSYNSCHPEMYSIIAMLLTTGINKDAIYDRVFNAYSADRVRLIGYCLYHKMKLYPKYHTALITLNRREIYRFNAKSGDMEGIVNMPLQIKDIYYSVFMREDKIPPHQLSEAEGATIKAKISLRSQGNRPVNILAREVFRGGGHSNASGGEFFGSVKQAAEKFEAVMPEYFLTM